MVIPDDHLQITLKAHDPLTAGQYINFWSGFFQDDGPKKLSDDMQRSNFWGKHRLYYSIIQVERQLSAVRVLKNSLVTRFIDPFSYENLSGQGTFSTPSAVLAPGYRYQVIEQS
jgi:hypothetical protein